MTDVMATLPHSADSVAAARRLVDDHAAGLTPRRRQDAGLMASLAPNAPRHGQGVVTVEIVVAPDTLRVEVADEGHGAGAVIAPALGASGGWGLRIVAELADGWGANVGSTRVRCRVLVEDA